MTYWSSHFLMTNNSYGISNFTNHIIFKWIFVVLSVICFCTNESFNQLCHFLQCCITQKSNKRFAKAQNLSLRHTSFIISNNHNAESRNEVFLWHPGDQVYLPVQIKFSKTLISVDNGIKMPKNSSFWMSTTKYKFSYDILEIRCTYMFKQNSQNPKKIIHYGV